MKTTFFLLFFSVVIIIYTALNYFVYSRGLITFSLSPLYRKWYTFFYWTIAASFLIGMIWERLSSSIISEWVYRIGAIWLAFFFYFLLLLLVVDIFRLFAYLFQYNLVFDPRVKTIIGLVSIGIVSLVIGAGYINARITRIKEIPLVIHKKVTGKKEIRLLMASDLHLGALIGEQQEKKLVRIINEQNPDLVLLCGDLVDGDIGPVLRKKLGKHIQEIQTPMGVYAIPGNHEYIGGIHNTLSYLQSINVKVLQDEVISLDNGIQLIGRDDRDSRRMGDDHTPMDLKRLVQNLDCEKPIIVMNHQPFNLDEAVQAGTDLHLSGHTHHGQIWPLNYLTKAIFEVSWGLKQKNHTYFYVSSGFGSWGPPVRIGNYPEVVIFKILFD